MQFQEGNVGIILSIPHGGLLDPEHVQDRQCQNCDTHKDQNKCPIILKNDGYTIDLGMSIVKSMLDYKNVKPNLVINNVRRSKLDPNREIEHGAQDNPEMIEAFEKYHDHIKDAKTKFLRGLLIDLHGQCKVEMTELGYLIPKSDLNEQTYDVKESSVAKLFIGNNNNDDENIISGSRSLGTFIQSQGYDAVPSSSHPSPGLFKMTSVAKFTDFK